MKDSEAGVVWTFPTLVTGNHWFGCSDVTQLRGFFGKTSQPTIIGWVIQGDDRQTN